MVFLCNGPECWKSYKASRAAARRGLSKVYWFRGGMPEWREKRLPVEGSAGAALAKLPAAGAKPAARRSPPRAELRRGRFRAGPAPRLAAQVDDALALLARSAQSRPWMRWSSGSIVPRHSRDLRVPARDAHGIDHRRMPSVGSMRGRVRHGRTRPRTPACGAPARSSASCSCFVDESPSPR